MCGCASFYYSLHLVPCAILTSIHDDTPLGIYDHPFKHCSIFIILFGTCMPVLMVYNSVYSSKGSISIALSTCSSISTSLDSFYCRELIDFFDSVIFTDIDTYLACTFSLLFLGGVTRANTTSVSVPGFVPSLKYILYSPFHFFKVPVSGILPDIWSLGIMSSFAYAVFDPFIFLVLFFPVSVKWVVLFLVGFLLFVSVYGVGVLCVGWSILLQLG